MLHRLLTLLYTAVVVCVLLAMLAGFVVIFVNNQELSLIVIIAVLAISVGYAIGNIHDDEEEEENEDGDEWLYPL